MRAPIATPLAKAAALLLALGLVLGLVTMGAYFTTFAPKSGYTLASSDSAWSNFGSYVGGVLGPLFSFLAFAGVLLTVWLQAKQIDALHVQANLEEVQRVISTVSSQLDMLLAQPPNERVDDHRLRDAPVTIFTVISAAGSAALRTPSDFITEASRQELIDRSKHAIDTEATAIGIELEQLSWCLLQYHDQHGSPTVIDFYRRRYSAVACWLDALGKLDSHYLVQAFFEPKEFRQFLMP